MALLARLPIGTYTFAARFLSVRITRGAHRTYLSEPPDVLRGLRPRFAMMHVRAPSDHLGSHRPNRTEAYES